MCRRAVFIVLFSISEICVSKFGMVINRAYSLTETNDIESHTHKRRSVSSFVLNGIIIIHSRNDNKNKKQKVSRSNIHILFLSFLEFADEKIETATFEESTEFRWCGIVAKIVV